MKREAIEQVIRVSKALSDATRFEVLRAIAARPEISCSDLVARFPFAQATISHHLRILAEAGLISARRAGQFGHYRARPAALLEYRRILAATLAQAPGVRPGTRARNGMGGTTRMEGEHA